MTPEEQQATKEIILDLVNHLPDSLKFDSREGISWGWEELSDEHQEDVKSARERAYKFLIERGIEP